MKDFFSSNNIVILIIIMVICGIGYYFGSKAIDKIPVTNLKARLLKALEYAFFMLFLFFIVLMKFQGLYFLSAPNEFTTGTTSDVQVYESIKSLQMAHSSFYYVFLSWIMTCYFLVRRVLQEKTKGL